MKRNVLIAAPIHEVLEQALIAHGYELKPALDIRPETAEALIKECVGVITSTRIQLDKKLIDSAPLLQWIGRMGSGMEVIDVAYATLKNIQCFSSPEGNANAVGEHALGLLLSLSKNIRRSSNEVMDGQWLREENRGFELEGKTIGIIGYGFTGKAFVKKLRGFDMNVLVYDKYKQDLTEDTIQHCPDLSRIYQEADIISFHVPLQEDTYHYFNQSFLEQLQKKIVLINTSRGTVVDTDTLLRGLESGRILATGLDVFEVEPIHKMNPLVKEKFLKIISRDNVLVTPHIGGYSYESLYKMSKILAEKITANKW